MLIILITMPDVKLYNDLSQEIYFMSVFFIPGMNGSAKLKSVA